MAILKVTNDRNFREDVGLHHYIKSVWEQEDIINRNCIGIVGRTTMDIMDELCMDSQCYGRKANTRMVELVMETGMHADLSKTNAIVGKLQSLIGEHFQNLSVLKAEEQGAYQVVFLINAFSPITGRYISISEDILKRIGQECPTLFEECITKVA